MRSEASFLCVVQVSVTTLFCWNFLIFIYFEERTAYMPKIRQIPPNLKGEEAKKFLIEANPHMDIKFEGNTAYVRVKGSGEPYVKSIIPQK